MNRFNNISTIFSNNNDNFSSIIVAIVTNNLSKVKTLINSDNVNDIIDTKNNYTALHYAVTLPNDDITKYILDLGANPKIKQNNGYDAHELSFMSGKKYIGKYFMDKQVLIIDRLRDDNKILSQTKKYQDISITNYNKRINELSDKIDVQNYNNIKLEKNNETATLACKSLKNTVTLLSSELTGLRNENKSLINENIKLKRSCDESDKAFTNLLKKQKK
jgi:ankyrin repeat protein